MFRSADNCCQKADFLQLQLMLPGLGTKSPTHFGCLVSRTVSAVWSRWLPRRYLSTPGNTCRGILLLFPLYPKIIADPWEEPKRAITSTMVPLIVTYFQPAGRTRCCKTSENNVIVNCAKRLSWHRHLLEHILHQWRKGEHIRSEDLLQAPRSEWIEGNKTK